MRLRNCPLDQLPSINPRLTFIFWALEDASPPLSVDLMTTCTGFAPQDTAPLILFTCLLFFLLILVNLRGRFSHEMECLAVDLRALALGSVEMEVAMAHGFAAAASAETETVALEFLVRPSAAAWSREDQDGVLRCVDRCQQRVYPPLDGTQFLAANSPRFTVADGSRLAFDVRPTRLFRRSEAVPAPRYHLVDGRRPHYQIAAAPTAAVPEAGAVHTDAELWGLARDATRQFIARGGDEARSTSAAASDASGRSDEPRDPGSDTEAEERGAAALRWRCARWLAERFVNEASWAKPAPPNPLPQQQQRGGRQRRQDRGGAVSSGFQAPAVRDILEAVRAAPGRRLTHADARGIECVLRLVGCTPRYAYLAAPASTGRHALLARIPVLEGLRPTSNRKRCRESQGAATAFLNAAEVLRHDERDDFTAVPSAAQALVRVRSHAVSCSDPGCVTLLDCFVVDRNADGPGDSLPEVLDLVRRSCHRYIKTSLAIMAKLPRSGTEAHNSDRRDEEQTAEPRRPAYESAAVTAALSLFLTLTDTTAVRFKKLRGGSAAQAPPAVHTWRDVLPLRESATVEFKQVVHTAVDGAGRASTHDRLRHTVAAMASTLGGLVVVGVTDAGEAVGHSPGAVLAHMRLTGFCPAMVKDSVSIRELPVLQEGGGLRPSEQQRKVITVITVQKGQAPFYSVSRESLPYRRGCASTTPMPILVMTLRLFTQLA
eukprot:gene8665-6091_t